MNSTISNNQPPKDVSINVDPKHLSEAWKWVLRLREDTVDQDDLTAWLRWYEADERNKEAFEDMQSFWQQTERVAEEPNPLAPELWLGELARSDRASASGSGTRIEKARNKSLLVTRRHRRKFLWASAALAAGLCGLFIAPRWAPIFEDKLAEISKTKVAPVTIPSPKVEETSLPDGSRVELAPKSQVSVLYSDKQRLLEMQNGEAYFTVAHNRERPFVVKVGNINVRAVGTAFNIRNAAGRIVVTVTEGTVDVYPISSKSSAKANGAGSADSVRVKAGSEVVWEPNAPGPVIASIDTSHALSWREGRLDYINEPLSAAVADINRYSGRRIVVRDDAVGKIVFSGTVLTSNTDNWIRALPSSFPIDLQTNDAGDILLVSRAPKSENHSNHTKAQ